MNQDTVIPLGLLIGAWIGLIWHVVGLHFRVNRLEHYLLRLLNVLEKATDHIPDDNMAEEVRY